MLAIKRQQIPLALASACTAHAAQGQSLKAVIADLALGRGVSSIASYVAITRVTSREGLLIFRPFDLKPFQEGIAQGTALLLKKLRGEEVDWMAIEDQYIPKKLCGICGKVRMKDQITKYEFRTRPTKSMCLECMEDFRDENEVYHHKFCEN